jgi:broad specificity polyphosphatase/5'/3'-nucleotidase SurE
MSDEGHSTSGGTIAGAVVGATAGVALLVSGVFFFRKRYKRGMLMRQQQSEIDNEDFYADPYQQGMTWNDHFNINAPQQNTYTAENPSPQIESLSDEYDEYGHPRSESMWSSISQRFKSLRI